MFCRKAYFEPSSILFISKKNFNKCTLDFFWRKEAGKGFLLSIVCINDKIFKKLTQPLIWTTFEHLFNAVIRQYFKSAYDVMLLPRQQGSCLKKSL